MGVNSLPKTVTRQRRDCDLNPGPSAPSFTIKSQNPYPNRVQTSAVLFVGRVTEGQPSRVQISGDGEATRGGCGGSGSVCAGGAVARRELSRSDCETFRIFPSTSQRTIRTPDEGGVTYMYVCGRVAVEQKLDAD